MDIPIVKTEDVVNGAFIYVGNTLVFTTDRRAKEFVEEQIIIIEDSEKPPTNYVVKKVRKVSLGYYEVTAWIQPEEEN